MISREFWVGRKVLVTGHTGFKGSWLSLWLHRLGAEVTGMALPPGSTPSLFDLARIHEIVDSYLLDIRDPMMVQETISRARPEVVFHLAAQPLVRYSYRHPVETFSTNVMGTAHLLESVRSVNSVRAMVMVTTDKVYHNNEWAWPYREGDVLGGHDPYSASKAASEIVIEGYRQSFLREQGVAVASARAGNVIGGGDWSEDRLLPDAVRAWKDGRTLDIRRPDSVRPWQHVLEPLAGYLRLAEVIFENPGMAGAFNFGPEVQHAATVRKVIELACQTYGNDARVKFAEQHEGPHEAGMLMLDVSKARQNLEVFPRWTLEDAIKRTMTWYLNQSLKQDARVLCENDISAFEVK